MKIPFLRAGELGNGLGPFGNGVFGKLTRQHQLHRIVDLPGRDHRLLVVSVAGCQWRESMSHVVEMARRWRMTCGGGGGGDCLACVRETWEEKCKRMDM